MGMGIALTKLLIQEAKDIPLQGNILTLGEQDVRYTPQVLAQILDEAQYPKAPNVQIQTNKHNDNITSQSLYQALGFQHKYSLDYSDFEGADLLYDMNTPLTDENCPAELRQYKEYFDVILDSGTMEHIFNVKSVFENIYYFLKPNGRIIHCVPSSNNLDHGFYMFSPCLFHDYYLANNYDIKNIKLFYYEFPYKNQWHMGDYTKSMYNYNGLKGGDNRYYIYCVAQKLAHSTASVNPMQGFYTNKWQGSSAQK